MEKTGPSVSSSLVRKDPWGAPCGRNNCTVCSHSPGDCSKKSIVYKWSCQICQEEEKQTWYFGESSRTLFERMVEHQKKMEKGDEESPLVEHHLEKHPGTTIRMKLELVKAQLKPLQRQVLEGQLVANATEGVELMNRKG